MNGNGNGQKAKSDDILNDKRPVLAKMPLEEQVDRLGRLSAAKPEGSRILEIGPPLAERILGTMNVSNRPMKPGKIKEYADALADGNWGLTGDTIKFSGDGVLRDGQNRLAAIVRSGVPMTTHVVFNVDPDQFTRMDIGKNRTPADVFHIAGFTYPAQAAATVRWLLILTGENPKDRGAHFTNDELLAAYRETFDPLSVEESVKLAMDVKKKTGAPVASVAALHYIMKQIDKEKADHFMLDWADGQGGPKAPTRMLQHSLVDISVATNNRVHESVRNALIIRAFNAYLAGKQLKKADAVYDPKTDEFPTIAGKAPWELLGLPKPKRVGAAE